MQQNTLLDEVKSHFAHWRTTRTKRGKIPGYLWDKVKPLVEHYPLAEITQALSVNTNQIKENINIDTSLHFVEAKTESLFDPPNQQIFSICADTQTCSIELHRADGGILKINTLPVSSLPAIITQFMV